MPSRCPQWPLGSKYQVVNFDGVMSLGSFNAFVGPTSPANTNLAWVIFALTFSYTEPQIAGGSVTPLYQFNNAYQERRGDQRLTLASWPTDNHHLFPLIGGGAVRFLPAGEILPAGRPRPLYLPFPDELLISVSGGVAGRAYQLRALVYETTRDEDVSALL